MQNTELEVNNTVNSNEGGNETARVHGGNIYDAARRFGLAEHKFLDFSSNVSPLGPSSAAIRAARRGLDLAGRYPDPSAADLRRAIARYFGIKPEHVVCGNGSTALIHLIPRVFRPRKVLVAWPTFSEYAAAARSAGAEVVSLRLPDRTGFRIDPVEMAFALKGADMAFLCNPNNPTGLLTPKTEVLEIAKYTLDQGARLVVDEAYMDFISSESIVKEAVQTSHLICVRSFDAFFGMPGLRLGYALSGEATIEALADGQEPWPVSLPAEHAGVEALNDWRHTRKTVKTIEKERERLLSEIRILPGVEAFPSTTNFLLIKVTSAKGPLLAEKLALRGLLVRDCSSFPGLDNRYIRITVRTRSENKRLVQALRELLSR